MKKALLIIAFVSLAVSGANAAIVDAGNGLGQITKIKTKGTPGEKDYREETVVELRGYDDLLFEYRGTIKRLNDRNKVIDAEKTKNLAELTATESLIAEVLALKK